MQDSGLDTKVRLLEGKQLKRKRDGQQVLWGMDSHLHGGMTEDASCCSARTTKQVHYTDREYFFYAEPANFCKRMPLYQNKPVELQPTPDGVKEGEEVFVIRFTGEAFVDYEYVSLVVLSS